MLHSVDHRVDLIVSGDVRERIGVATRWCEQLLDPRLAGVGICFVPHVDVGIGNGVEVAHGSSLDQYPAFSPADITVVPNLLRVDYL